MKCPKCHKPVEAGKHLCPACGCRISEQTRQIKKPAKGKYTQPKKHSPLHTAILVVAALLPALLLVFLLLNGKPEVPEEPKPTEESHLSTESPTEVPAESSAERPTEPAPTEMAKEGYVREDCSELNIRKGPSVTFGNLGHLEALDPVLVTEITTDGEREWGRIELGWVCLDYIQWGKPPVSGYEIVRQQYRDTAPGTGIDTFGPYVNENVPWVYEHDHINYAEVDLNKDGIKECVVAARENDGSAVLLDLFTLADGKPVHLVQNMGGRAHLRIYPDGSFGIYGSSGAGYNTVEFFELPQNSTEPHLISGAYMEMENYYIYEGSGEKKPGTAEQFAAFEADWNEEQLKIKWTKMK